MGLIVFTGQKLDFDNTINKETVKHEPRADAGKYQRKQQKDKSVHTPVGLPSPDEGSKKKKKKKRKNKDKEENEREEQASGGNVDEDSKPAVKKPTKEDPKCSSENNDIDVDELKNLYNETVQLNSSKTSSQKEFCENPSENPCNDISDKDSRYNTPSDMDADMHRNIDKENVETCTDVNKQKHAEETDDTKDEGNI